jgi:hypothetical protein
MGPHKFSEVPSCPVYRAVPKLKVLSILRVGKEKDLEPRGPRVRRTLMLTLGRPEGVLVVP